VLLAGLDVQQVASALSFFVQGDIVNHLYEHEARNPIPIRLVVPHEQRITPDLLAQTFVKNREGVSVPLSTVIDIVPYEKSTPILHKDNERVSYVGGELAASAPVYAVLDIDNRIEESQADKETKIITKNLGFVPEQPTTLEGTIVHWDGEVRLMLDIFRDLGLALALSLVAIYFLLVAYYQSFSLPLLVMISIPLGLIGVFPGHWLLDQDFTAPSMIGVIALAGVAVRNSLLIVDFIRERIAEGIPRQEAIADAGALRIIPITLTTLAIVFGTMVMIPDPVMGGLAISLIFGSIASAILTVFVVPLLYARKG
jgi:multidrug efflux pump subunit AcrB